MLIPHVWGVPLAEITVTLMTAILPLRNHRPTRLASVEGEGRRKKSKREDLLPTPLVFEPAT